MLTQDAQAARGDPLEGVLPPLHHHAEHLLTRVGLHAVVRRLMTELHRREAHGAIEALRVGNVRPELLGAGRQTPLEAVHAGLVARVGRQRMCFDVGALPVARALEVSEHLPAVGVAIVRVLLQRARDHRCDSLVDVRAERPEVRRWIVQVAGDDHGRLARRERRLAGEDVKERRSEGVHVGLNAHRLGPALLRGHVPGCTWRRPRPRDARVLGGVQRPRDAEVAELDDLRTGDVRTV